jgi:hypothetical protein
MTAFAAIVGRSMDSDSTCYFSSDGEEMTTSVAIVAAVFRSTGNRYSAFRLRQGLPRDNDLAIGFFAGSAACRCSFGPGQVARA